MFAEAIRQTQSQPKTSDQRLEIEPVMAPCLTHGPVAPLPEGLAQLGLQDLSGAG